MENSYSVDKINKIVASYYMSNTYEKIYFCFSFSIKFELCQILEEQYLVSLSEIIYFCGILIC